MTTKAKNVKATTTIQKLAPQMKKLLKRKDGVTVSEAVDSLGICKKSVRKLLAELNAKPTDYIGVYKS